MDKTLYSFEGEDCYVSNQQMKKTMNGAILLSLAALIAKILSAVYRVPFQNMVGNTGFYVYQQVYPIYGIGMTIALSGFPVFLSKLVAETKNKKQQRDLVKKTFFLLSLFSIGLFSLCYFGAPFLADKMGDKQLVSIIQSVSWLFLLVPILATGRGYFQGTFRMLPTAVSQVVEQVVRVAIILTAAYIYTASQWTDYQMGAAAMSSSWIAGLAATLVLGIAFFKKTPQSDLSLNTNDVQQDPIQISTLTKRLMTEGLAICVLSAMLILLQLMDSFTLYKGLIQAGFLPEMAKNVKGIYDRGQPLVQLGMVVATAFSTSLVPVLSRSFSQKKEIEFLRAADSLIRITLTFALAATAGLIVLMPYLNQVLFGDRSGTGVLNVYTAAVLLASLIGAYNAILQSRNQHYLTLGALLSGMLTKWLANQWLVERMGTMGASIATILALMVILCVIWLGLPSVLQQSVRKKSFGLKLIFSSGLMAISVWVVTWVTEMFVLNNGSRLASFGIVLIGILIGVIVFVFCLLKWKVLTVREWLTLPFGKRILRKQVK